MFMKRWQTGDNTLRCTRIPRIPLSLHTHFGIHHNTRTTIDSDIDHYHVFSLFTFSLQISRHRERGRNRSFLPTRRSFFEWQLPDFSPFPISLSLSRFAADPASVRWEPKNVPMQRVSYAVTKRLSYASA